MVKYQQEHKHLDISRYNCGEKTNLASLVKWGGTEKKNRIRPWWDSNPQSPAPEADALSIRPQGPLFN